MVIKTDVLKNKKTEKSTNNKIMSKRRHRYVFVCMENLMKVRNLLEKHTFLINNANKSLHFRFYFCCQFKKKETTTTTYKRNMFMQTNFGQNFLPLNMAQSVDLLVIFCLFFPQICYFSWSKHHRFSK